MRTQPEIELTSPLGQFLAEQAAKANVIVEIGTGCGIGSTRCLYEGQRQNRAAQTLLTVEGDVAQWKLASDNMNEYCGFVPLLGVVHRTIRPYFHPLDRIQDKEMWHHENKLMQSCPSIVALPMDIDLLFLDGGEYTSDGDFLALWQRSNVIVIDDCNTNKATKNIYARAILTRAGWKSLAPNNSIDDRNGWAAFTR